MFGQNAAPLFYTIIGYYTTLRAFGPRVMQKPPQNGEALQYPLVLKLYSCSSGGRVSVVMPLDTRPAIAALDHRHQFIQRDTFALGFQGNAAVPVVGDPPGQAQLLGGALGK